MTDPELRDGHKALLEEVESRIKRGSVDSTITVPIGVIMAYGDSRERSGYVKGMNDHELVCPNCGDPDCWQTSDSPYNTPEHAVTRTEYNKEKPSFHLAHTLKESK